MIQIEPQTLAKVIKSLGVVISKSTHNSYILDCPKCGKKDKLYIRKKDAAFICFSCGELSNFKGRADFALSVITGEPLESVRSQLLGEITLANFEETFKFKLPIFEEEVAPTEDFTLEPQPYPASVKELTHKLSLPGVKYLESRGVNLETALRYNVRYDIASKRVIFPVEANGDLYGWQGRYTNKTTYVFQDKIVRIPKILTQNGTPRDKLVMFYDRLLGSDKAVICEGPMDAIACDLIGGNVATMGKIVTKWQIQLIRHLGVKTIYLGLDPDAIQETLRLINELEEEFNLYILEPLPGFKDLGEMTPQQVYQQYLNAKPVNKPQLIYSQSFNFNL